MKVLHINTIDTGGAAIAARRLHVLLLKKGIDSKILFLQRSGKSQIPESYYLQDAFGQFKFQQLIRLNKLLNRKRTFLKPELYFNGPESLFDISKHPLFEWADVVHLHWVVKMLDWKKVFSHKDKSFVWTLHDMNPFTGGEHYQTGYNGEFSNVSKKHIEIKKRALNNCKIKIVSPSQWLGDLARQSEVFSDKNIYVIRNPIDTTVFKPLNINRHTSDSHSPKNILFVAENPHDERKGFKLLLKALENMDPKEFRLSVLGNKKHVESVFPNAFFYDTMHNEEKLVEIYNQADLFVIPSLEDNLPNTVSESLLCGTPVVGLSIGGIKEMIDDGVDGFLAENVSELKSAIERGLHKHFERSQVAGLAQKKLDTDSIIQQYQVIYESFK